MKVDGTLELFPPFSFCHPICFLLPMQPSFLSSFGHTMKLFCPNLEEPAVAAPKPAAPKPAAAKPQTAPKAPIVAAKPLPVTVIRSTQDRVEPIKGIRKAMAKTMAQSLAIPHFGYCDEVDVTRLVQLRPILKPMAESRGVRLSYMPFFIKALSIALYEYPDLNSHLDEKVENLTIKGAHHVGIAMDTPNGLLVPNVKNVESKSILEVAADLNRLQELGMAGQLSNADLTGATISISNIGTVSRRFLLWDALISRP